MINHPTTNVPAGQTMSGRARANKKTTPDRQSSVKRSLSCVSRSSSCSILNSVDRMVAEIAASSSPPLSGSPNRQNFLPRSALHGLSRSCSQRRVDRGRTCSVAPMCGRGKPSLARPPACQDPPSLSRPRPIILATISIWSARASSAAHICDE